MYTPEIKVLYPLLCLVMFLGVYLENRIDEGEKYCITPVLSAFFSNTFLLCISFSLSRHTVKRDANIPVLNQRGQRFPADDDHNTRRQELSLVTLSTVL